jgi:hypothetical protein
MTDWLKIGIAVALVLVCGYLLWRRQKDKKIDIPPPEPVEAEVVEEKKVE